MSLAQPFALLLLLLVPFFAPLRGLAIAAVVLALAQPSYLSPAKPVWRSVHASGDLGAAVQHAAAQLPDRGRIALHSDGRESAGSLLRAASELHKREIALYYAYEPPAPEVALLELALPQPARAGVPFALEATVASTVESDVELTLTEAERTLETREEHLPSGASTLRFQVPGRTGEVQLKLTLRAAADTDHTNDTLERRVRIGDRPRVLLLDSEPQWTDAFATLLRSSGFDVDLRGEPEAYDFVVLSDLPASALPSQRALIRYVQEGGGLLVAGGAHAFGPGGYRGSALERILPVTLEGGDARNEASLALVLAIDKSGSMAGDKLERAKEAALATAALLPEDAYLGVIGFDVEATRIVRLARAGADVSAIGKLGAGGGTALFPALDAAYGDLAAVRAQLKHVVVLTDGQTQEEALGELVRAMHADGITISTVGLGEDVQHGLLSELAKLARGRAYFTRDPSQIPRLFVEETERVARSLVVERAIGVRQVAPAAFLRGVAIGSAPPLRGFVETRARPGTTLLAAGDAPILARMRVGEGWSLAWTSDLKPRWSAPWFAWPGHAQLFAQLVREHMRRADGLTLELRPVGGQLEVSSDVVDDRGRFVNGLTGTVELDGASVPFEQVAPGRYSARVAAHAGATVRARIGDRRGSRSVPPVRAEGSGRALLETAARLTGGGPVPTVIPATDPAPPRPLWPACLWVALGAFLLDLTHRRRRSPGGLTPRYETLFSAAPKPRGA
ncbi:MAG TPA: VWA domain-containing protein [Polyangiales bacterium]|nr:VWA domain-containing protein [Polyangiales bacterium]